MSLQKTWGNFHLSALGRLIQHGEPKDAAGLRQCIESLCTEHVALHIPSQPDNSRWQMPDLRESDLHARQVVRNIADDWRVTSYSGLQQHGQSIAQDLMPKLDVDAAGAGSVPAEPVLTPHQFPRGASPGTFLHSLFEELDFTQPVSEEWVLKMLQSGGYDVQWQPVLTDWIRAVLHAPLTTQGISLNQLTAKDKQVEMEFYLPISQPLMASQLDALIRQYDPLSVDTPTLDFRQVRGMLKGFIDLTFEHAGRWYILDYKSNWLGPTAAHYGAERLEQAIAAEHYHLQYLIYLVALRRFLRTRLAGFSDEQLGGAWYLFLRGMPAAGVYFARPSDALLDALDRLFAEGAQ